MKIDLNVQKEIAVFSEKFGQLHFDFISNIKKQYPDLTSKELKLLAYLKVGLSNKQIANIQNTTISAVHKMRYRIKKKIKLDTDTSLDDFINRN